MEDNRKEEGGADKAYVNQEFTQGDDVGRAVHLAAPEVEELRREEENLRRAMEPQVYRQTSLDIRNSALNIAVMSFGRNGSSSVELFNRAEMIRRYLEDGALPASADRDTHLGFGRNY